MKVYRVVGSDGMTMYSNRNTFSGLYYEKEDAERALAAFKGSWCAKLGPFSIQESTEFEWKKGVSDDTAPYYGS